MTNSNPGLFQRFQNFMTPERALQFQGLGMGLSQIAAGAPVNLSPVLQIQQERQRAEQMRTALEGSGAMEQFSPQQRAILASMEPSAAQRVIASVLFREPEPPKTTDDMTEYEAAVAQGYQGTFMDYMTAIRQAGATTIDMGGAEPGRYIYGAEAGLPQGWRFDTETQKAEMTPGGPVAQEAAEADEKAALRGVRADTQSDVIIKAAGRALQADTDRSLRGLAGQVAALNPSSPNAEVVRQVAVLQAINSLEQLNAMRQASPTGGALGAVSEAEGQRLIAAGGALDPASPNFERDLRDYTEQLLRTVHGDEEGDRLFAEFFPEQAEPAGENPYLGITQEDFANIDISGLSPAELDQLYEAMNK